MIYIKFLINNVTIMQNLRLYKYVTQYSLNYFYLIKIVIDLHFGEDTSIPLGQYKPNVTYVIETNQTHISSSTYCIRES